MPFVQCEYAHAMGNGPGGLGEYQDLFESAPRCMGGFVWEWIDHGLRQIDEQGRMRFAYGGDFGEAVHDGNFVADGLLFPDRTPSPGLLDYAAVIAPVRFSAEAERLRLTNYYDFRDLSGVVLRWAIADDGVDVDYGSLVAPPVKPHESALVQLPAPTAPTAPAPVAGAQRWLTVDAVLADDENWAPAGHVLSTGQVRLRSTETAPAQAASGSAAPPSVTALVRRGADLVFGDGVFDARTGALLSFAGFDVDGPRLDLWRAPTDNDNGGWRVAPLTPRWRAAGLDRLRHRTTAVDVTIDAVVVHTRVAPAGGDLGFATSYRWSGVAGGLRLDVRVVPEGDVDFPLPKLALRLRLPGSLAAIEWFGRGPGEAYADTGYATRVGRFRSGVDALQVPYVMPQENGRRAEVRWAEFAGPDGAGVRVEAASGFGAGLGLTARRWTSEQLDAARHTVELTDHGHIWVGVDVAQQGIGSASCGPGPLPRYRLEAEVADFAVVLRPIYA
jgi:beta-galactosidase